MCEPPDRGARDLTSQHSKKRSTRARTRVPCRSARPPSLSPRARSRASPPTDAGRLCPHEVVDATPPSMQRRGPRPIARTAREQPKLPTCSLPVRPRSATLPCSISPCCKAARSCRGERRSTRSSTVPRTVPLRPPAPSRGVRSVSLSPLVPCVASLRRSHEPMKRIGRGSAPWTARERRRTGRGEEEKRELLRLQPPTRGGSRTRLPLG